MCTILALFHTHPRAPLIIAANRDEVYARKSLPPEVLREVYPRAVGGRDLRHGGTWMGLNEAGLFVGLTNLRAGDRSPHIRSRGEIVLEALGCESPDEVVDFLELRQRSGDVYRPFNLMFGNTRALLTAHYDEGELELVELPHGQHVMPSATRVNDSSHPKVPRAHALLEQAREQPDEAALIEALQSVLADRQRPSLDALPERLSHGPFGPDFERELQALCVRTPTYGTVSSTLIITGSGAERYLYADGPPDTDAPHPVLLPWSSPS